MKYRLEREGVPNQFVPIRDETRIDFSIELTDGKPPTCVNEPGPTVYDSEVETLVDLLKGLLPKARWLVLGGSHPPGTPTDIFRRIGRISRNAGIPFALDADGDVLKLGVEAGPTFLKPNAAEASRFLGRPLRSLEDCILGAREICDVVESQQRDEHVVTVVSRGALGAVMSSHGKTWIGESPRVEKNSTVGSGDSMVGAMLTLLDKGCSPPEAFQFGLAAGAATAAKMGGGLANLEDLEPLLDQVKIREA